MTRPIVSLVDDILDHYRDYRANLFTGKAMIVVCSCSIAMKMSKFFIVGGSQFRKSKERICNDKHLMGVKLS